MICKNMAAGIVSRGHAFHTSSVFFTKSFAECPAACRGEFHPLMAFRRVSTEGTFASLPDSSENILQAKPGMPWGCNSFPSMNTEGDPLSFSSAAFYPFWKSSQNSRKWGKTSCFYKGKKKTRLKGFEPLTHCLEGSCSIRLSYRRMVSVRQLGF